jgi:uridine kinase
MTENKDTVKIFCKNNNSAKEVEVGKSIRELFEIFNSPLSKTPLCARVNNRVEGLEYRCWKPKDVEFAGYSELSGFGVYLRTLCLILSKAASDLFKDDNFKIEHAVSKGYYCVFSDKKVLSGDEVERLKKHMQEIIDADIPVIQRTERTAEAAALFKERNMNDRALLFESAGMPYTYYYELDGFIDCYYGPVLPSTGRVHLFDIVSYEDGILLRVPRFDDPATLNPVVLQAKMLEAYKKHLLIQQKLGIENVGDLNSIIQSRQTGEIVLVSEALQEKQIAAIAGKISQRYSDGVRLILISGPSSSGKTTFCRRLQIQLYTEMLHPMVISLDDYYVNREDTPRDESGNYDFESLYAIELTYFKNDLKKLIEGQAIHPPSFNFETGKREYRGNKLKLRQNSVLLLEGIHGLNPELTSSIPEEYIFRIYVSALTTISLDSHNWISTADNRLIRRIVRDYQFRGYSAKQTISMWPSVRKGEDKWIFPYQENADETFNSAMIYELSALRRSAEHILREVRRSDEEYAEAYRLLHVLEFFNYMREDELPSTSLLREFIGGGN